MGMKTFKGGIHSHDFKELSKKASIEILPLPEKVVIPLSQHIGTPAKPVVKTGDEVKTGQLIAEQAGFISIPMHSSVSGKVKKIGRYPHPGGSMVQAIEIESDGKDEWVELEEDKNFDNLSKEEIINRIKNAGVCGMGGAGFPTYVKLSPPPDKKIDTVILNGVECEPFLTADYRLMLERPEEIVAGLKVMMKVVGAEKGIIGIEANKPDAVDLFRKILDNEPGITVDALQLKYPQGAEKQLIYALTKRKVPNKGGLPMAVGVVVSNVGTAVAVYEAVKFKKPLVERITTMTGTIVRNPKNLQVRIGTLFDKMLDFCGGTDSEVEKIISGGPMMGFAISTLETPVCKTSSGVILFNKKEAFEDREHTCIRCGGCVDVCPMNLLPSLIANAVKYSDWELAEKANVMDCMKCGCCSFVCPSRIKLIQWIDIGKNKITSLKKSND